MIVLHNVIGFFHAELFVKLYGILVCDEVHSDVLFTTGYLMCGFHQAAADTLPLISTIHTEVRNVEPIRKVRYTEQCADQKPFLISRGEAYRNVFDKLFNAAFKAFLRLLRAEIRSL